jgi:hypothetical protein
MKIMRAGRPLAWALACWAATGLEAAAGATVRLQVMDGATGQTVPARAYLWRGDEPLLPPGFSSYTRGNERHLLVPGDFELDLEPGTFRLRVERGLEYIPVELARFLDSISGARVGVNFDTANLVLYGMDDPPASSSGCWGASRRCTSRTASRRTTLVCSGVRSPSERSGPR